MIKYLSLFTYILICTNISAQLNIDENFSGMTAGNLGGQNNWISTTINDVQVIARTDNTGALTYSNYTSGTNSVRTDGTAGADPSKAFVSNISIATNSYTYISFLVRVSNANDEATSLPTVALRTTLGNNLCYFYIARNGSDVRFGISKSESGTGDGTYRTQNYLANTTYLIVIGYSLTTGSNNDVMALYVNPAFGIAGPSGSPLMISTGSDGGYSGAMSGLQLFQNRTTPSFTTYATADAQFDAFRVASGVTSTEAWTNLSPEGTILPVTFGTIKAFEKNNGVQLVWTVHDEINVSHYEIERSSNGGGFVNIAQQLAFNDVSTRTYLFFDPTPLSGTSFYRIRNVDNDSRSKYSIVVRVNISNTNKEISLYPNPVISKHFSIQSSFLKRGDYIFRLYNAEGKQVYTTAFSHTGGFLTRSIQLNNSTPPGIYHAHLSEGSEAYTLPALIIQ